MGGQLLAALHNDDKQEVRMLNGGGGGCLEEAQEPHVDKPVQSDTFPC